MRAKRAAMTSEEREAYLSAKRTHAAKTRATIEGKEKGRVSAAKAYRKQMADPVRKAARRTADREAYWANQSWVIARGARLRARKLGVEHNLTKEWVAKTWTGRCEVTGIAFALRSSTITAFSPSVDRVDNNKGYTQDNCRWVLFGVNAMKNVGSDADLLFIASAIVARSNK